MHQSLQEQRQRGGGNKKKRPVGCSLLLEMMVVDSTPPERPCSILSTNRLWSFDVKINASHTEKLSVIVGDVQARAKVRCIGVSEFDKAVKHIEKRLATVLLKKDWVGLSFSVSPHFGKVPNSYKGTPETTKFTLLRAASGWFVTAIERGYMPSVYIESVGLQQKAAEIAICIASNKYWNN
ncbi:hypothetical protein ACM7JK_07665 [Pseudomonas aeruginosa]